MAEKVFTIIDEAGVHARPATLLIQTATRFKSDITIEYKGRSVNLKSIMGVMSLGITQGAQVKITASGEDETGALTAITDTMETNKLIEKELV